MKAELANLASRLRSTADVVARVLETDHGDGMCISDLQEAMYWLRPVIAEVEALEDVPSAQPATKGE